jgi:UDPglucose 6-dehydrogenase
MKKVNVKIAIIGVGYVGLVAGACFAKFGFKVVCVDKDVEKIEKLKKGEIPIYERGLDILVKKGIDDGSLGFSIDIMEALSNVDIAIIAVGTPTCEEDGSADLTHVFNVVKDLSKCINKYIVLITKSTVPVGTSNQIAHILRQERPDLKEGIDFDVVSNPEFLREGSAIDDFMKPNRVIVGYKNKKAKEVLSELYKPLSSAAIPVVYTSLETAELIKYASNAFLAMKISFINQIADLCEKAGADVLDLTKGIGLDGRIGLNFLNAGPGYGGSCFPKDTRALSRTAKDWGVSCSLVDATINYNEERKLLMAEGIIQKFIKHNLPKKVAILGITFKPDTDDLREAPSLTIIPRLVLEGFEVNIYDPLYFKGSNRLPVLPAAIETFSRGVIWHETPYAAVSNAEGVVVVTEWEEFKMIDLTKLNMLRHNETKSPLLLIDLRNIYHNQDTSQFIYYGVGR